MGNNRYNRWNRNVTPTRSMCSCGNGSKLRSRTNWPFGRNSEPRKTRFYKCSSCKKEVILTKHSGGKR